MMLTLESTRIQLRALNLDDAEFIVRLLNTPDWLRFIGDRKIQSERDAQEYLLGGPIHSYMIHGFGFQCIQLKETGVPVGLCGLIKRDGFELMDIGFALLPEFYGLGLAYDAVQTTLEFAKTKLKQKEILAITNDDNQRSINLLKKVGFESNGTCRLPNEEKELLLWKLNLE